MQIKTIVTIFRKELLDILRDRRTLIFMVLVPIIAIPVLMVLSISLIGDVIKEATKESITVVVRDFERFPDELKVALQGLERAELKTESDYGSDEDLSMALEEGKFEILIELSEDFNANLLLDNKELSKPSDGTQKSESTSESDCVKKSCTPSMPVIKMYYDSTELKSKIAIRHLEKLIENYKEQVVEGRFKELNISPTITNPFTVETENVAPNEKIAGREIGFMIPFIMIIICFLGAMYPAIDLAAGEKERGTLETLLVSPALRSEFIIGKYLVVMLSGMTSALLAMISMTVSFNEIIGRVMPELGDMGIAIRFDTLILMVLVILPLSGIFAGALLSLSVFARSFKEAQSYISVLNMVVIMPAIISFIPGIEMDYTLALIPVANASLLLNEAFMGNIQWGYALVAAISSLFFAGLSLVFAKYWFEREAVLFRM